MSVVVENVDKFYGAQHVLNKLSFKVPSGEVVGFLGPNGAGKSTTMKIITGFIPASAGKVLVQNIDVAQDSLEVRKHIGYLPESNPLYYDMYVREYLHFVGKMYGMKKNLKSRIDEVLQLTDLLPEAHKKAGQLSKGYKQRLGIAQAILHNPDVLILDEPTTGLDPNQISGVRKLIRDIGKEKTVILSTHIMQEVEAVCNRAIIINEGKIVADKPIAELENFSTSSEQKVEVEFLNDIDIEKLKNLDFANVDRIYNSKHFLLKSVINYDIRPKIFNFAVQNGFVIVTIQENKKNLEEVFKSLTTEV